jgi:hypothetical protein
MSFLSECKKENYWKKKYLRKTYIYSIVIHKSGSDWYHYAVKLAVFTNMPHQDKLKRIAFLTSQSKYCDVKGLW